MQLFSGKPKQPPAPSKPSSTSSGRTGSAPVAPRTSGPPSPPSKARPTASVPPPASPQAPQPGTGTGTGTGTTEQQAAAVRKLAGTIAQTHELAGQAVGYLADMATSREGEGPSQIEGLVLAVAVIAESQARMEERQERMEAKLDRVLRLLQPRPA